MKLHIAVLLLLFTVTAGQAQEQTATYLWPIENAKAGSNILCAPQGYVGREFNFDNLIIGAPEGTRVLSPADGTVEGFGLTYWTTLQSTTSFRSNGENFDTNLATARKTLDTQKYDPKYLSGNISIDCGNGTQIHIYGLSGTEIFKTGQQIKKGTPIGKVAYSYHKTTEPSIMVSISRYSKSADPMTPFGIKSSFIPPAEIKPVESLTKEQAQEDFTRLIDALKEVYPGLYDVIGKEELEQHIQTTADTIGSRKGDWDLFDFWGIISKTTAKIHDSHISVHLPRWWNKIYSYKNKPSVRIGWFNDTLIVKDAHQKYHRLIGRPIRSVNKMSADSLKKTLISHINGYDAKVEQFIDYSLAMNESLPAEKIPGTNTFNFDMNLEFTDGEKEDFKGVDLKSKDTYKNIHNQIYFSRLNKHPNGYQLQMINDSVAYVGLSTFKLNQVQIENIAAFIDSISGNTGHLIIDVRNNGGGDAEVLSKLYSYIAGEPLTLHGYSKVNKKGSFHTFKYSMNYSGVDDADLFSDYQPVEGKDGYYLTGTQTIQADPSINYKGKVYVLANEKSTSAATLFPALLVRNHRGVVIGRETNTAYHFMNAVKFVDIRLPNSTIVITIPLISSHFDDVVNERVPYGRGVLPDYYVPLTFDETICKNGDVILNRALEIIKQGTYLKNKNPFSNEANKTAKTR